jgi:transitional endoplasmic reticulum ATPase
LSDLDDTLDILRAAVAASPRNPALRRQLAALLTRSGRHDEAVEHLREALKDAPDDAAISFALAEAYLALERRGHALVVLESLVAKHPHDARSRALLARLLLAEGKSEAAGHHYREAIEIDPEQQDDRLAMELGFAPRDSGGEPPSHRIPIEGIVEEESDDDEAPIVELERPKIDFSHVGGMDDVKAEIAIKVIEPLRRPDLYKAYGKRIGGGILLFGPPGCGKTHLARATAGEVKAAFFAVSLNDVLDMWFGNSEKRLGELFATARRNTPCVLFFDEVDALAANRSDLRHSSMRTVVNQFLSELDGAAASNDGVLVLAATNAPWQLDPAFRRPGRFDRVIFVPPPDAAAREAILGVLLAGKPVEAIDGAKVAKATDAFSGADLKGLVDLTIEDKLREALKRGTPAPITTKDLLAAAKRVKPSTREWLQTARNHVLYANQGGQYDDVKKFLGL